MSSEETEMSRMPPPLPVTLELAPLPRAQVGPYLILGVDKDADRETIEAAWAKRLIWARKGLTKSPLEDINWAREMLSDSDRRVKADAASLNVDTTDGILKSFRERFEGKRQTTAGCRPIDIEKSLADYQPPTPIPDLEEVRKSIPQPEIPREVPSVRVILEEFIRQPIDPWDIDLDT
ncbi:MAG: hypothetical protein HY040_02870 [Planctomycetes bacterium]|nr:hypothetical protein [Planctomycetota bacterium]